MAHSRLKIFIAVLLLFASVGYLSWAGVRKGWVYYVQVDAFLSDSAYRDQRVRLVGQVAQEGVVSNPGLMTARFELLGNTRRIPVVYEGVIPDTFKPGSEVVLEGRMDGADVFQADVMMTKCASKYQAQEHAKRLEADS